MLSRRGAQQANAVKTGDRRLLTILVLLILPKEALCQCQHPVSLLPLQMEQGDSQCVSRVGGMIGAISALQFVPEHWTYYAHL